MMKSRIIKTNFQTVLVFLLFAATVIPITAAEIEFTPLTHAGRKTAISSDLSIVYEFNERPKLGMVILKIQVFDKKGNKVTPLTIQGRSGMPSMPGHHDSGQVEFKLSRKKDYLMPVDVVMPGDWEVQLTFLKDGKAIFFGRVNFDV